VELELEQVQSLVAKHPPSHARTTLVSRLLYHL
jgi:hypothetical protein